MNAPQRRQFQPSFFGAVKSEWLSLRLDDAAAAAGGGADLGLLVENGFGDGVVLESAAGAEGRSMPQASQTRKVLGLTSVQMEQAHEARPDEMGFPGGGLVVDWCAFSRDGRSQRVCEMLGFDGCGTGEIETCGTGTTSACGCSSKPVFGLNVRFPVFHASAGSPALRASSS